ncbi:thioredoxin family protein [Lacticaseibacillus parakribbianus]|uniref:thioredoxin family protein n=1 Tax=Lacticaseibacillus parakribbianus TaxID=2970927 RepID=UPI0021CB1136|nr:thioredoxin family protein [Lacticaseibacillus parakribbianus]
MATKVTSETMAQHLGEGLTVVDLWAPWCGPCKILSPMLRELEQTLGFTLLTLDVDGDTAVATQYGVQSVPTMLVFRGGKAVEKITGAYPKAKLAAHFTGLMEGEHGK